MRNVLLIGFLLMVATASAQDKTVQELRDEASREVARDPADTIPMLWRKGGIFSLNIAQGSLNNWAAGGDEFSLSLANIISLYALYKKDRHSWDNTLDFNYGFVRTTSLGSRKNDDRLDLFSKYGYGISSKWSVAALANFRTQFFKGYTYNDGARSLASDLFSPAYLLLGVGLDYKPTQDFSVYLSPITARLTIVSDDSLSAKGAYGVHPGETVHTEYGAFLSASYIKTFSPTLSYKGRLDLFSNYRSKPGNIDLFMTNIFSVNLIRALSATWNIDLIYDDDVRLFGPANNRPRLQLKSLVGVGLLLKFGHSRRPS